MNGSMLSQPPRLIPRMTCEPYFHCEVSGGVLVLARVLSFQLELRPMTESPPTVSFVNVVLKPVVSYHVEGSRYVPCAYDGTEAPDTCCMPVVEEVVVEEVVLVGSAFFLLTETPTTIAMMRTIKKTITPIPMRS